MKREEAIENESKFLVSIRPEKEPMVFWNGLGIANMLSYVCNCTPNQANSALSLLARLGKMESEIIHLKAEVTALHDGPRCSGHKWRNKPGRLYMHHALNDDCPMHGPAPAGADRGLRSYVKAEDEESTLAAAANYELWKIRTSDLTKLERTRDSLSRQLKMLSNGRGGW